MVNPEPLKKIDVLIEEFNRLSTGGRETFSENELPYYRIARESESLWTSLKDFKAGHLAAISWARLGKTLKAETLFKSVMSLFPIALHEESKIEFYLNYAQFLTYLERQDEAWEIIKHFEYIVFDESYNYQKSQYFVKFLMTYAKQEPSKLLSVYQALVNKASIAHEPMPISSAILFYYLWDTSPLSWADLYRYAVVLSKGLGFPELNLDNLDEFIEDLKTTLTQPLIKPDLTEFEQDGLSEIKQILLMFLTYPIEEIYFPLSVKYVGHTFEARVTREYDGSGFSAVIEDPSGAIITYSDSIDGLKEMLAEALFLHFSEAA